MRLRPRTALLALAAGLSLGACSTYDGYGHGYGGVSIGYGSGYYDSYYDPYWDHYASNPYWGWYDGYYYPGTGIYIYDAYRRPYRWNDRYARYWTDRRHYWDRRGDWREDRREFRDNWRDFRRDRRTDDRAFRMERREDRDAFRRGDVTREQFRTDRR